MLERKGDTKKNGGRKVGLRELARWWVENRPVGVLFEGSTSRSFTCTLK